MKQRFTSLLFARIRQLIFRAPNPPPPAIPSSIEDAFSLDTEAMIKGMNDDLAAIQAQMEEIHESVTEIHDLVQQISEEWNDPTLSDESRALLKKLIRIGIRELNELRDRVTENLEIGPQKSPLSEFTLPSELPKPDATTEGRPIKRQYFSTPDQSSASSSPSEQRADCRRGS